MVSCVLKMHRAVQLQRLQQLPLARLQVRPPPPPPSLLTTGLEEGLWAAPLVGEAQLHWDNLGSEAEAAGRRQGGTQKQH